MPRISEFYGIKIRIFYREPHWLPHFQALHAGKTINVSIETMEVLSGVVGRGRFDVTALDRVMEWGWLHQQELLDAWADARRGRPLPWIEPLPGG